jgi:hypothetical protein
MTGNPDGWKFDPPQKEMARLFSLSVLSVAREVTRQCLVLPGVVDLSITLLGSQMAKKNCTPTRPLPPTKSQGRLRPPEEPGKSRRLLTQQTLLERKA